MIRGIERPLSITIQDMASGLGVSRKTLSKIINEHGAVTPDMALRLSRAFNTTPELWLNL
jgi:antitoxin HigA-1